MKKLVLLVAACWLLQSCVNDEPAAPKIGKIKFGFSGISGGRLSEEFDPAAILISIEDKNGNLVADLERLELYNFSGTYITNTPLELEAGTYKITQCLVVNHENDVTHVMPMEGTTFAYLIDDPLPISFDVSKDELKTVNLQVVAVTASAMEYGYVTFSIGVVNIAQKLSIDFNFPTPDYFVNEGYSEVIVTLTKGNTTIVKSLDIESIDHATGELEINWSEIETDDDCSGCWKIKVQAFFEVIDAVDYITHMNETLLEQEIVINQSTQNLSIVSDHITSGTMQFETTWHMQSHFSDDAGYYRLTIDNDFCSSRFDLEILKNVSAYSCIKYMMFTDNDSYAIRDFYKYDETNQGEQILPGMYNHSEALAGICEEISYNSSTSIPELYFEISEYNNEDEGIYYGACYIVWEAINDPNDPTKNGRVSGNTKGAFKVVSPEEYKLRHP